MPVNHNRNFARMRPKEREEQRICCYGAFTWGKIIAYLQLIFGGILLIMALLKFIAVISLLTALENDPQYEHRDPNETAVVKFSLLVVCVLSLINALFVVLMGVILLVGLRKDNTGCLTIWIVLSILAFIFGTARTIVGWNGTENPMTDLIKLVVQTSLSIFGIWVVWVCRREILRGMSGRGEV